VTLLLLVADREPNGEGEVPLYFRHGPEKQIRRFQGCLTVSANDNDKAVYLVAYEEDKGIVHPQGYLGLGLRKHLSPNRRVAVWAC
jgi:hypothetical protein